MTCEGQSSNFILMNQDSESYIKNKAAEKLLRIKSERIEIKKMDLAPLLLNNNNFAMHEYVSYVSMPSVSFLLNDGISNLTKPY